MNKGRNHSQPLGVNGVADSPERLQARLGLARSGASGIHEDQHARKRYAAGHTNRVGSRAAQRRAALSDYR